MDGTPDASVPWRDYRVPHLLRCGRCDWTYVPETLNDSTKAVLRHARGCPAGAHPLGHPDVYADVFDPEDVQNVARLLLEHCDLLGVADTDVSAEAEYRHEALDVLRLLARGADVDSVARHLSRKAEELHALRDAQRDTTAARAVDAYAWLRSSP